MLHQSWSDGEKQKEQDQVTHSSSKTHNYFDTYFLRGIILSYLDPSYGSYDPVDCPVNLI